LDWDDLRVLLALLRAGNLNAAATRLALDASTVSRRVARIEGELEARLFARTRDGLRPTAAAERLRRHAEAMEMEAAAAVRVVGSSGERASGLVRIATTEGLGRVLVQRGLLALRDNHPDLLIELLAENRPVDLARGEADLAVRLAAVRQPSLRVRCIAKMGVGLFASQAYLRARPPIESAARLRGHDVLLPTGSLSRLPEARWLASRAGVRVAFRSDSMPALVAAAVAGRGLVPVPLGWGATEPDLVRVLTLDVPPRKVWLVTHAATERTAVAVVSKQIASIFLGAGLANTQV
jgi:DNA-binding transcriptional LysR family regulator